MYFKVGYSRLILNSIKYNNIMKFKYKEIEYNSVNDVLLDKTLDYVIVRNVHIDKLKKMCGCVTSYDFDIFTNIKYDNDDNNIIKLINANEQNIDISNVLYADTVFLNYELRYKNCISKTIREYDNLDDYLNNI